MCSCWQLIHEHFDEQSLFARAVLPLRTLPKRSVMSSFHWTQGSHGQPPQAVARDSMQPCQHGQTKGQPFHRAAHSDTVDDVRVKLVLHSACCMPILQTHIRPLVLTHDSTEGKCNSEPEAGVTGEECRGEAQQDTGR